jgi:hypothetical protein
VDPDIESIDLAALAAELAGAFGGAAPEGYLRGRTALRDAVAAHLGCSDLMAEDLVETMISRGWLRFDGDPTLASEGGGRWAISA